MAIVNELLVLGMWNLVWWQIINIHSLYPLIKTCDHLFPYTPFQTPGPSPLATAQVRTSVSHFSLAPSLRHVHTITSSHPWHSPWRWQQQSVLKCWKNFKS